MQTVCLAFSMPLTIGLTMLLVWNLYLALQNKTTIEFHEGVTANMKACCHMSPLQYGAPGFDTISLL